LNRADSLVALNAEITACRRCPRLVEYRERVALAKRRAYLHCEYWGKPAPGFGDPGAQLLVIGLAPAAHGANRTGRVFTGDRSGDFLYRALHATGFASQPESVSRDDGLTLSNAYISAAVRCAPPDNRPALDEFRNCRPYLERELTLLDNVRVVVALGKIAFDTYLAILLSQGKIARRADFQFGHDREHRTGVAQPVLVSCYHPSQQNTSTGKLTAAMLQAVFERASHYCAPARAVSPASTLDMGL
jgi:uracil-DNA glycosylase family 4